MAKLREDHLVIPQGTTWAVRWPILSAAGLPIDTVGWTVRSQVRRRSTDDEILHEWSTELGNGTVFDSMIELRVSPEESSLWKWGRNSVVFDVEVTNAVGEVIRVTQGTISLSAEVTR